MSAKAVHGPSRPARGPRSNTSRRRIARVKTNRRDAGGHRDPDPGRHDGRAGGRGFTEHFILVNGRLLAADSGKVFPAEEVMVSEYHRFEGASDPDDMAILYAIQTRSGLRETLADALGGYADPLGGGVM